MTRFILFYFIALCFIDKLSYSVMSYHHITDKHDESKAKNDVRASFTTYSNSKTGSMINRKRVRPRLSLINISVVLEPEYYQSPINIIHEEALKHIYPPVEINNLGSEEKFLIINTGHTYKLKGLSREATLTGGSLFNKYIFNNLHFHWGKTDSEGSEHRIDYEKFPLEAHFLWKHFIDYNVPPEFLKESKSRYLKKLCVMYKKQQLSAKHKKQLFSTKHKEQLHTNITSDVGIVNFIKEELDDLHDWPVTVRKDGNVERETIVRTLKLKTFNAIYKYLKWIQVNEAESSNPCDSASNEEQYDFNISEFTSQPTTIFAVIAVFFKIDDNAPRYDALSFANLVTEANSNFTTVQDLLSQILTLVNFNQYYTYSGSTTTPPFPTSVTWIVLRQPIFISHEQLDRLRLLLGPEGIIRENWREVQPIAGRFVYFHGEEA